MRSPIADKGKIILGITGGFGSGKSTVAARFKSRSSAIIDADSLAHGLMRPGSRVYKKIISAFGRGILKKDRAIDRRRLGKVVFADKDKLRKLNTITHPEVIRMLKKKIKTSEKKAIILDIPLLVEAGLKGMADKIIVVKITREEQVKRLIKKSSLSREDILKRINAQAPLSQKLGVADFIIDNSGTIKQTEKQVEGLKRRLLWKSWTSGV